MKDPKTCAFSCNKETAKEITKRAATLGMNRSQFIVALCLSNPLPKSIRIIKENGKTIYEVKR